MAGEEVAAAASNALSTTFNVAKKFAIPALATAGIVLAVGVSTGAVGLGPAFAAGTAKIGGAVGLGGGTEQMLANAGNGAGAPVPSPFYTQ